MGVLGLAALVVVLDQLTKSWAVSRLRDEPLDLVGGAQLFLTYNRGVAFGLGEGVAPLLVGVAIVGLVLVVLGKKIELSRGAIVGVGLLFGGALGNLCDRLLRDTGGAVIDFIDLGWWPVFNVADSAIVLGALVIVVAGSRKPVSL